MNARIKLSARAALTGRQLSVVPTVAAIMFFTVVFSLCPAAVNYLTNISGYAMAAISVALLPIVVAAICPLRLALQLRMILLARGSNSNESSLGFAQAFNACKMGVCLFALKLFWLAAFEIIPISGAVLLALKLSREAMSYRAVCVIAAGIMVLAAAGLCFYLVFIQRYSKAMFYLACYKDFSVSEAIFESVKRTRGEAGNILLFKLGFMPWFLLCLGVIPALFVIPYYKQSVTCYCLSR